MPVGLGSGSSDGRARHLLDALEVVGCPGAVLLEEPRWRPVLERQLSCLGGCARGLVGPVQAELSAQQTAAAASTSQGSACSDTTLNVQRLDTRPTEAATRVQAFLRGARLERRFAGYSFADRV